MIDVVYYLFNSLGITSHPGRLMLPKWVKVSEKRFNEILSTVTEAINNEFTTNVDARETTLDNTESLLKGIGSGKIDKRELKKNKNIADDVESTIKMPRLTRSQNKMVEVLSLLKEIADGFSYEESNISEQESDK